MASIVVGIGTLPTLLDRPLRDDEANVWSRLSAQGIAKVNTDASRGVPIEQTLLTLCAAFEVMQTHRHSLLYALGIALECNKTHHETPAKWWPQLLNSAALEELMFLYEALELDLLDPIVRDWKDLEYAEQELAEMAASYLLDRLRQDCAQLSGRFDIRPKTLVTTDDFHPSDLQSIDSVLYRVKAGHGSCVRSQCVHLQLSPVVCWFTGPTQASNSSRILQTPSPLEHRPPVPARFASLLGKKKRKTVRFGVADPPTAAKTGRVVFVRTPFEVKEIEVLNLVQPQIPLSTTIPSCKPVVEKPRLRRRVSDGLVFRSLKKLWGWSPLALVASFVSKITAPQ